MGVTRLRPFLRRHKRIALDTSIFIYQLEENPRYIDLTNEIFRWVAQPFGAAITSTITMAELLVQPYRNADEQLVNRFYGLLTTYPNLDWIAPDLPVADIAAKLRAAHRLRTPDALQAACAIHAQATGLITNDAVFQKVDNFETLLLDDLLQSPKSLL